MADERDLAEAALMRSSTSDSLLPDDWPPVARRVREARQHLGLSEGDIASRLGITLSEYWDIEAHNDEAFECVSVRHLEHLATILGVSLTSLLFGSQIEASPTRISFATIAARLQELAASQGRTIDQLGDVVGWDLTGVIANPESLDQFNLVGLRDVCRAIDIDWVSALPRPEMTDRLTTG